MESTPLASVPAGPAPAERFVPRSLADLKAVAGSGRTDWVWQGYLASGSTTLLTSLWKSGKSTLISVLLARMKTGGTVAGLSVRQGRAVVISEEPPFLWLDRGLAADRDDHIQWFCQPFLGRSSEADWRQLLGLIGQMHAEKRVDLLVIDSLANLAPMRTENDAVQMLKSMEPFQALSARGITTLITHHPKKGPTLPGQAARGSGALAAYVDIIVEMFRVSGKSDDRRRRLRAYSRYSSTPANLVIAWTPDGADYDHLGSSAEPKFEHGWPTLQQILNQSPNPLKRQEILRAWPDAATRPAKHTLWKWLKRAIDQDLVQQKGRGTRRDPHRYSLAVSPSRPTAY
jgi:hypothetical protein